MPKRARDAQAAPPPPTAEHPRPAQAANMMAAAAAAAPAVDAAMAALLGNRAPILFTALIFAQIDAQREERKRLLDASFRTYEALPPLRDDARAHMLAILDGELKKLNKFQPVLRDEQRQEVVDHFTTTKMIISTCGRFACVTERREFEGIRVDGDYTKGGLVVTYARNDGGRSEITREFASTQEIACALFMDKPDHQTAPDNQKKRWKSVLARISHVANPKRHNKFLQTERAWVDPSDSDQTIPRGGKVSIARRVDAHTKPWCVVLFDLKKKTITTASHNARDDRWAVTIPADVMRAGLSGGAETGIDGHEHMMVATAIMRMAHAGSFRNPLEWKDHDVDHITGDKHRDHLALLRSVTHDDNVKNTDVADYLKLGAPRRIGLLIAVSKSPNDPETAWTILASHGLQYTAKEMLGFDHHDTLRRYMRSDRNGRSPLACGRTTSSSPWTGWFVRRVVVDPDDRAAIAIRAHQDGANRAVADYADQRLAHVVAGAGAGAK